MDLSDLIDWFHEKTDWFFDPETREEFEEFTEEAEARDDDE